MFNNIKVINSMVKYQLKTKKNRQKYTYGNKAYSVRESREHIYAMAREMCQDMLKSAQTKVEVKGEENLNIEGPVLFVANHKSVFDIVILISIIKQPCIFIGKKEVEKMPLAGQWCNDLGCIYMDRSDMRQSLKAILQGIDELKKGQSLVIFPEGTRTYSKEIKNFKEGSFKLATKANVPIIPIALQDTYKILEEKRRIQKTTAYVNIGSPIYVDKLEAETKKQLSKHVQGVVQRLLDDITI